MTNLFGVDTTPLLTTFVDPTHDNCKINLILKGKLSYVKNIIDEVFTDSLIPVDKIRIDILYQRPEDFDIKNIIKNLNNRGGFSYRAFNAITVYKRADGYYYVVDGMHRVIKALLCGVKNIPAVVMYHSKDSTLTEIQETESDTFLALNNDNKKVGKNGTLKAGIIAKNKNALEIERILNECGWCIKGKAGNQENKPLTSYGYLESAYDLYGKDVTVRASALLQKYGFLQKPNPTFLFGLCCFLHRIYPDLSQKTQDDFIEFIKSKTYTLTSQKEYTEKVCYGMPAETVATRLSQVFNRYAKTKGYAKKPITRTVIKQLNLSNEYVASFERG